MKLFLQILFGTYHAAMGVCLFITVFYLVDAGDLWFTHGIVSLFIPLVTVTPIVLMVRDSYFRWVEQKNKPNE